DKAQPILLGRLFVGSNDFDLVSILQGMTEWNQFVVYLGSDTGGTNVGVYLEGKVQCCSSVGQLNKCTFGCEDEYFIGKEVHLEVIQKIQGILLGIAENITYLLYPLIQSIVRIGFFVFPVCGKPLFGNFI